MLSAIREKTQGIIATIIFGLVIIPFALWGTYSYFEGGADINVAEVDGIEIGYDAYRFALDRLAAGNIDPALLDNPEVKKQVLNGLIEQTLLVDNVVKQGYRISDADLGKLIRAIPGLQRNGVFDPELYQALLRQQGLNEQSFEQRLRTNRVSSQIQSGLAQSAILLPSDKAAVERLWQQTRGFDYVVVRPAGFEADVQITDDEMKTYYDSRPDEFKTPEQLRIEYIQLSASDLANQHEIPEDKLRAAYNSEVSRYTTPERRRTSHILIEVPESASDEAVEQAFEKAQKIERQLRDGADFAALAKEHSADTGTAENGGDLGFVERGTLPKELEEVVFKQEQGSISKPVRTSFGYHIAKITEYTPGSQKSFDDVRTDIEKLLRKRRGEDEFFEKFEEMNNLVYENPDSLTPAAEALSLTVTQSDWFDRDGGNGVTARPKVIQAAFSPEVLHDSRNSDTIELDQQSLVALRVIGHREAKRKAFDEVRAEIKSRLVRQRARERAIEVGTEVARQVREGKSIADVAKAQGLRVDYAKPFDRLNPPAGIDRRLTSAVFQAQRPAVGEATYGEVDLGHQGYAVFALTQVKDSAAGEAGDATKQRVQRVLEQRHGSGTYAGYVKRLRETADVEIFSDRL